MRKSAGREGAFARAVKFIPLVRAWLWRRPARTILAFVAVTAAFTLYGLALGEAEGFRQAAAARHVNIGQGFLLGAMAVSAIGMALILFLTANAMAQSVRLRLTEFGILKAVGYSHRLILTLVTAEAALPCLAGAVAGLAVARLLFVVLTALLPPLAVMPPPVYSPAMLGVAALLALLIGGVSGALPAARIVRLDVAAALAGGLRATATPRRNKEAARQQSIAAEATPPAARRLRSVVKADKHLLRQIMVVTRIGLATLRHRIKGGLVIVVGVGVMAFVLLYFLSMAEGIRSAILDSGDPSRAIIRAINIGEADWLDRSALPAGIVAIVDAAPGVVHERNGTPLVDAETFNGIGLIKRNNGEKGFTTIAGVGPRWREMTPSFRLLSGRLPRAGTREVMAGTLAQRKFSGLDGGFADYKDLRWRIVGTFTTGDWWDAYLLGDAAVLKAAAKSKTDNAVLVRLSSPSAFANFRHAVAVRLPQNIMVERETDYYADFWRGLPKLVIYIAYLLGGLIGAGAFAGTVHTMHGAVEERAREIAILRALGFDGAAVAASVVIEAMLLAALGALIATALVWLWRDGFLYNGADGVFRVTVDLPLLLQAIGWGLAVALPGALGPALRLARQTPIEALRDV